MNCPTDAERIDTKEIFIARIDDDDVDFDAVERCVVE